MTRFLVIAALLIASSALAEEKKTRTNGFLNYGNGLAPVAAANLGLYLGEVAFGSRPEWQGYQLGGEDRLGGFQVSGDCASSNGSAIAKALTEKQVPEPPTGVIRLEKLAPGRTETGEPFDMKAMYQAGQGFNCPQ
jgi:hypothetical protein